MKTLKKETVLTINDYQDFAKTTAIYDSKYKIIYPLLGLINESGEVLGKLKKTMRDNSFVFDEEYTEKMVKELGDVMWYTAALSSDLDIHLEPLLYCGKDIITFNEFQDFIKSTLYLPNDNKLIYFILQLTKTCGKLSELSLTVNWDLHTDDIINQLSSVQFKQYGKLIKSIITWISLIADQLKIDLDHVIKGNVDKLSSRKERNTLHGDGDNR